MYWHEYCSSKSVRRVQAPPQEVCDFRKQRRKFMPPRIDQDRCIGCGVCMDICPMQVFRPDKESHRPQVVYGEECWHCNSCVLDCPRQAISLRIPAPFMMLHVDASDLKPSGR